MFREFCFYNGSARRWGRKGGGMPRFKVAHIREQGVDLIIVPLESAFGFKGASEQRAAVAELQVRAGAAGLAGTVVPVWDGGGGRMSFMAPQGWHPFFQGLSLPDVGAMINKEIWW